MRTPGLVFSSEEPRPSTRLSYIRLGANAKLRVTVGCGFTPKKVIIAHDLPLRDRLMAEQQLFEVKTSAAGSIVLDARATEHYADLAVAAAIALYHSNVGAGFTGEGLLAGYY